jgi:hypothetical protein
MTLKAFKVIFEAFKMIFGGFKMILKDLASQ